MSKDKFRGAARRFALLHHVAVTCGGSATIGARHCPPLTKDMRRLIAGGYLQLRRRRAFGVKHLRRNRLEVTDKGFIMATGRLQMSHSKHFGSITVDSTLDRSFRNGR